jgi:hypothetical protein
MTTNDREKQRHLPQQRAESRGTGNTKRHSRPEYVTGAGNGRCACRVEAVEG